MVKGEATPRKLLLTFARQLEVGQVALQVVVAVVVAALRKVGKVVQVVRVVRVVQVVPVREVEQVVQLALQQVSFGKKPIMLLQQLRVL